METINNATITVFGILGLIALYGVIFCQAYHHIVTIGICSGMVLAAILDNRRENKIKL